MGKKQFQQAVKRPHLERKENTRGTVQRMLVEFKAGAVVDGAQSSCRIWDVKVLLRV